MNCGMNWPKFRIEIKKKYKKGENRIVSQVPLHGYFFSFS